LHLAEAVQEIVQLGNGGSTSFGDADAPLGIQNLWMTALLEIEGLAVETTLLFPFALSYLLWLAAHHESAFVAGPASTQWLLVAAGPVTAIPLLLFAAGARRIPFATLGVLQYAAPTLQLLLGVWIYHEPFAAAKLIGYVAIWIALIIFTGEGLWSALRSRQ